ncbi:hypothetical protein PENTCL1PPCAC_24499, partial [Pristionchus entomophagus]
AKKLATFVNPGIVRYHNSWIEEPPSGWQKAFDTMLFKKLGYCMPDDHKPIQYGDISMFLYIQTEVCKSSLAEWLSSNKTRDPIIIKSWFNHIVCAVAYIHAQNTMHRDLKPGNILVSSDDTIKICDLGIATTIKSEKGDALTLRTDIGTNLYKAPEQFSALPIYDHRVDIFAMGLILLEKAQSWTEEERSKYFCYIRCATKLPFLQELPDTLDLVTKLTKLDKDQRPGLEEILKHPFFSE